jgi:transcription antitermination factor NusG
LEQVSPKERTYESGPVVREFCKYLNVNGLGHKHPVSDGAELSLRQFVGRMANLIANSTSSSPCLRKPSSFFDPFWYAAYTSANHEKSVAEHLTRRSVEHFLPLYEVARRWKDRRVHLQIPLFPGYVFVRLALRDRLQVLQVPGIANLVGFSGTPAALPQEEIDALRTSLASGARAQPHPYLAVGRRVLVKVGPLAGMEGILLRQKSGLRVVISIELIRRSVAVELDGFGLEPVR